MATPTTYSRHAASLDDAEIVAESELGSIRKVTADTFPMLNGLSTGGDQPGCDVHPALARQRKRTHLLLVWPIEASPVLCTPHSV